MLSFRPRLLECLRDYSRARFMTDVLAGISVGLVALPLAIGLGVASGVSPGAGIFTAIIGGFLVSALGGSRVQIGGPAGAFVGLVYAIILEYGLPSLLLCTAMAGVLLFIVGAARLGTLVKFIPFPVTTGFTCGIATDTTRVTMLEEGAAGDGHEAVQNVPRGVLIYRVFGALLFGAADKLDSVIRRSNTDTRVVILHMAAVTALDATALNALDSLHEKLRHHKKHLILSGPHTQPFALMEKSGYLERVGAENVVADLESGVARARELIGGRGPRANEVTPGGTTSG